MSTRTSFLRQAIITKYHGPTERRGARISATAGSGHGRIFHSYPYELNNDAAHFAAAEALRDKMGWTGDLIQGATRNGFVFVFAPPQEPVCLGAAGLETAPAWMPEDYTCGCGLHVHPTHRNPKAIHIADCPYRQETAQA